MRYADVTRLIHRVSQLPLRDAALRHDMMPRHAACIAAMLASYDIYAIRLSATRYLHYATDGATLHCLSCLMPPYVTPRASSLMPAPPADAIH